MNLKRHENDAKREEIWKNDILRKSIYEYIAYW